jgi:four helix bundle protein
MRKPIRSHTELRVYRHAFESAMKLFRTSKNFPIEERYSLTDQVRRSSRSVCSNIAEAWRKRRYDAAFVAKLNDAEAEASETQTWIDFAVECGYLDKTDSESIRSEYDIILGQIVSMIRNPDPWLLKRT